MTVGPKLKLAAGAALLVVAALVMTLAGHGASPTEKDPPDRGLAVWLRAGMGQGQDQPSASVFQSGLESLPGSLRGTEVPGTLDVDSAGNLKINHGLRDMFDYFLSTGSEESAQAIAQRIAAYAKFHLPPKAAQQLIALYSQYLDYKDRLGTLVQPLAGNDLDHLRSRLAAARGLRAQVFNPEVVQAFFADEDVYDDYQLDKALIMQNQALSAADKAKSLAQLRKTLPESMRDSISVVETVQTLNAVTDEWKQHAGSTAELRSIRESLVGADAADRLETLDTQTAQWNGRVNTYLSQRAQILQDASLSDAMKQQQIQALRRQQFQGAELVRVDALERISDSGLAGARP